MPAPLHRSIRLLRRFAGERRGAAMIEFAFVMPIMVAAYVGGIAATQGIMAARKATALNHTIGDLVAQAANVTTADLTDDFNAASDMMTPLSSASSLLRMRVSRVYVNSQNKTCIDWSATTTGSTYVRSAGDNVDTVVPAAVRVAGATLIMPELEYDYTPVVGKEITGTVTFKRVLFLRPRQGKPVTLNSAAPPSNCPRS